MIRAVEFFTRVLYTGGQSDLCAQFLYADLTLSTLGTETFPTQLSEEELNDLLCGKLDHASDDTWYKPPSGAESLRCVLTAKCRPFLSPSAILRQSQASERLFGRRF